MMVVDAIIEGVAVQQTIQSGRRVNGHRLRTGSVAGLGHHDVEVVAEPVAAESRRDLVDEWGLQSFPASDPPANW